MRTTTKKTAPVPPGGRRAAARPVPGPASAGGRPLTNRQKAVLCQMAALAWAHCRKLDLHGAGEAGLEAWRRARQGEALGAGGPVSLRDCGNNDFRPIKARYLDLLGWGERAFVLWLHTGRACDTAAPGDTHERREELEHLVREELVMHRRRCLAPEGPAERAAAAAAAGRIIGTAYAEAVCRGKFGRGQDGLAAGQLEQLLATLRNRIAAREGRGDPKARNSKQRREAAARP